MKNKSNFISNINRKDLDNLLFFVKFKPFCIIENDKNLGVSIISTENYKDLCLKHLNDNTTYVQIKDNPLEECVSNINKCLFELYKNNSISKRLFDILLIKSGKSLGKFRILLKIHKTKFGVRPIVNCTNSPTEKMCQFIDILLKKECSKYKHILKDSQQLLQDLDGTYIDNQPEIYSCDFDSLYLNIEPGHACQVLTDYMKDKLNDLLNSNGFYFILKLIFENNYFMFYGNFYKQKKGVAMGCKCGPSLANLYIYLLERHWLSTVKDIIVYARFIDDILIIAKSKIDLNYLLKSFIYLKLNIVHNEQVEFLDLCISYDKFLKKIKFNLYIKPTNNGMYLLPYSNHPNHIVNNIPYSLFTRIKRICSNFVDYLYFSFKTSLSLVKRKYDFNLVCSVANKVNKIERNSLLPYKDKNKNVITNSIKTCVFYDSNYANLKDNMKTGFDRLKCNFQWLSPYDVFIYYKIFPNLSMIFIHNFKTSFNQNSNRTSKCQQPNCKICMYIFGSSFLTLNNQIFPLMCSGNCLTQNIVYIILCSKCNVCYIGETSKSLRTRICQHLYKIKTFKPYIDENVVGRHFRKTGHNLSSDFRVCIFKRFENESDRKNVETDLINLFLNCFKFEIINSKIISHRNLQSLSFI